MSYSRRVGTGIAIYRKRLALACMIVGCVCLLSLQSVLLGGGFIDGLLSLQSPVLLGSNPTIDTPATADANDETPTDDISTLLMPVTNPSEHDNGNERLVYIPSVISDSGLQKDFTEVPTVLIYHTHTTEAYNPTDGNTYIETSAWRTNNTNRNIVTVGEHLADILRDRYNINVIHVTENFEPPKLSTSYTRSCAMLEEYTKQYKNIDLVIDVHRDAYTVDGENMDYVIVDGEKTARLMFVVGKGTKYAEAGSTVMKNYESNLALAQKLTNALREIEPKLARDVRIKSGRYNQHIVDKSLLVEVGHNANSLNEALAAVEHLAFAISKCVYGDTTDIFVP